jgi:hypothetical protein
MMYQINGAVGREWEVSNDIFASNDGTSKTTTKKEAHSFSKQIPVLPLAQSKPVVINRTLSFNYEFTPTANKM